MKIIILFIVSFPLCSESLPKAPHDFQGTPQYSPHFQSSSIEESEGTVTKKKKEEYDDEGFNKDIKLGKKILPQFNLNFFVNETKVEPIGKVKTSGEGLFLNSEIEILSGGRTYKEGDVYSIYKDLGDVKHAKTEKNLGHFFEIVAEVKIIKTQDGVRGLITRLYDDIKGELFLTEIKTEKINLKPQPTTAKIQAVVANFFTMGYRQFGQGSIGLIDKGKQDGVESGMTMQLWSDQKNSASLGEILIIQPQATISLFVVMKNADGLVPGVLASTKQ